MKEVVLSRHDLSHSISADSMILNGISLKAAVVEATKLPGLFERASIIPSGTLLLYSSVVTTLRALVVIFVFFM